jgi:hypothetical protein
MVGPALRPLGSAPYNAATRCQTQDLQRQQHVGSAPTEVVLLSRRQTGNSSVSDGVQTGYPMGTGGSISSGVRRPKREADNSSQSSGGGKE